MEREVYTVRAAETAGLTPEALRSEVERACKRRRYKEKKAQIRRELNPSATLQPERRELRYANLRSALAEEGILRLMMRDDDLLDGISLQPEEFSSRYWGKYMPFCRRTGLPDAGTAWMPWRESCRRRK